MDNENPQQEEKTNELIIRQQRISNTAHITFRKKKKKHAQEAKMAHMLS